MARTQRTRTDPARNGRRPARQLPETGSENEGEQERRAAAAERLGGPFVTRAWHSDGTEYTDKEYEEAGIKPPSPAQRQWLDLPFEERMRRIEELAEEFDPDEEDEEGTNPREGIEALKGPKSCG